MRVAVSSSSIGITPRRRITGSAVWRLDSCEKPTTRCLVCAVPPVKPTGAVTSWVQQGAWSRRGDHRSAEQEQVTGDRSSTASQLMDCVCSADTSGADGLAMSGQILGVARVITWPDTSFRAASSYSTTWIPRRIVCTLSPDWCPAQPVPLRPNRVPLCPSTFQRRLLMTARDCNL